MTKYRWMRVSRTQRCWMCGKPDWCTYTVKPDNTILACCMRVESDRPADNGGWLHVVGESVLVKYVAPKPERKPTVNWIAMLTKWQLDTHPDALHSHALALGVTIEALEVLGAAYSPEHKAWAFPMRNGYGSIIGIRLRAECGDKWAVKWSSAGLFIPQCDGQDRMFVCEGPTDTAAALSIGLYAVGRPSCLGQDEMVGQVIRRMRVREAVIVADADTPGQRGADRLQESLRVQSVIWTPPAKDLRQAVNDGLTYDAVNYYVRDLQRTYPKVNA